MIEYSQPTFSPKKEQYNPAYRGFVFYRTMSPNEVSTCLRRNMIKGGVKNEVG